MLHAIIGIAAILLVVTVLLQMLRLRRVRSHLAEGLRIRHQWDFLIAFRVRYLDPRMARWNSLAPDEQRHLQEELDAFFAEVDDLTAASKSWKERTP